MYKFNSILPASDYADEMPTDKLYKGKYRYEKGTRNGVDLGNVSNIMYQTGNRVQSVQSEGD